MPMRNSKYILLLKRKHELDHLIRKRINLEVNKNANGKFTMNDYSQMRDDVKKMIDEYNDVNRQLNKLI